MPQRVIRHMRAHRLFTFGAGLFCAYWGIGYLADPYWFSSVASGYLLIMSVLVGWRVVPEAIDIVRRDEIAPGEMAVIALALIAMGGVYTGLFNVLFYIVQAYWGRPESWIGAPSSFGRALIGVGFLLFALAPDIHQNKVDLPRWYWLFGVALLGAGISFMTGYYMNSAPEYTGMHNFNFPLVK